MLREEGRKEAKEEREEEGKEEGKGKQGRKERREGDNTRPIFLSPTKGGRSSRKIRHMIYRTAAEFTTSHTRSILDLFSQQSISELL